MKAGRCSHHIPSDIGEDALEEYKAKLEETDKPEDRFREVGGEGYTPFAGLEVSFTSKVCGDT